MTDLRHAIGERVRAMVGAHDLDLTRPDGDVGLFGPGSATWAVHGDFTAMMIGGMTSLLVQMLHPAALAGVLDHSDFRVDSAGRLRRTAQFITVTTFGSTVAAERAIARVRAIHRRVSGVLPDGTHYRADDPALLTWVHAAEVDAFLRSHLRYRDPHFSPARQDAYLEEMAFVAAKLGADEVPRSRRALDRYFDAMRPDLLCDARTRSVARLLLRRPEPSLTMAPASLLIRQAAVDLMPRWAADLHGLALATGRSQAVRAGGRGVGHVLRWALAQ